MEKISYFYFYGYKLAVDALLKTQFKLLLDVRFLCFLGSFILLRYWGSCRGILGDGGQEIPQCICKKSVRCKPLYKLCTRVINLNLLAHLVSSTSSSSCLYTGDPTPEPGVGLARCTRCQAPVAA